MDRLSKNLAFSIDVDILKSSIPSLLDLLELDTDSIIESKVMVNVIPLMDYPDPTVQLQAIAAVIHFFYATPAKFQHLLDCGFLQFLQSKEWINKNECLLSTDISRDDKKKLLNILNTKHYTLLVAEVKRKKMEKHITFPSSNSNDLEILLLHLTNATIPQFCNALENSSSELFHKTLDIVKSL